MLLDLVKTELEKNKKSKPKIDKIQQKQEADDKNVAIIELYELTQRKFLKNLTLLCDKMTNVNKPHPKLFAIDLLDKEKLEELKTFKYKLARNSDEKESKEQFDSITETALTSIKPKSFAAKQQETNEKEFSMCLRPMCEHEEGWHFPANEYLLITELNPHFCPYLARIMNIIKNGNLVNQMQIFLTEYGHKLISDIESKARKIDLSESYIELRKHFIFEYENSKTFTPNKENKTELKLCELKNGNISWLCPDHIDSTNARQIPHSNIASPLNTDQNIKLLNYIEQIIIDTI